jgi:FtsP/CotA-like multicopper oxidase with cupredoxin domain
LTGVTRYYDFTVSRGKISPDGYEKDVLLINGAFPGPAIEANWGDTIQVIVRNNITGPKEGTSMHWHGLLQKDKPWMDGVPGVHQCPIAPGSTFTYSFKADLYGTSWYHSHYSAQSGMPPIMHSIESIH